MSLAEVLASVALALGSLLAAILRDAANQTKKEVERQAVRFHESETMDLTELAKLRKEMYEAASADLKKDFEEEHAREKALYDNLQKEYLKQVISHNEVLSRLNDIERQIGEYKETIGALTTEKQTTQNNYLLEVDAHAKTKEREEQFKNAAEEGLRIIREMQEAATRSEMTIQTLNNQVTYLTGVKNGILEGVRNLPLSTTVESKEAIEKKDLE